MLFIVVVVVVVVAVVVVVKKNWNMFQCTVSYIVYVCHTVQYDAVIGKCLVQADTPWIIFDG